MKVGLLYPRSNAHPTIGIQFIDGLKKCLLFAGLNESVTLISEGIGFGGNEKEAYQKAEKLLIVDNVDLIIVYLDLKTLVVLEPLVFAAGKLMIVVNAGANYPSNWVAQPNIIYLTLQHSFLCWLNGLQAAKTENKNALLASSYYDCGYLHSAAMVKNFFNAGGNITYNYINNQPYDNNFNINELIAFLSTPQNNTSNLLCVLDSKPAELFYHQLKQFAPIKDLHLFVSPMMLEESALKDLAQTFPFLIEGYLPWHFSLDNEANKIFKENCLQQTKYITDIFSLQGWETGLVIQQILLNSESNYYDGADNYFYFIKTSN